MLQFGDTSLLLIQKEYWHQRLLKVVELKKWSHFLKGQDYQHQTRHFFSFLLLFSLWVCAVQVVHETSIFFHKVGGCVLLDKHDEWKKTER